MKKLLLLFILLFAVGGLAACDFMGEDEPDPYKDPNNPNDPNDPYDPNDPNDPWTPGNCDGYGNYVVIEGQCIPVPNIVSGNVNIGDDETIVNYMNSVELMTDFVADLTGSTGLAVVSRDVFEDNLQDDVNLSGENGEEPENLIVKLNEEGFFEEVSFTDDMGFSVEIKSNPLALEVFGEFTVVAFEVDFGYDENHHQDFTQKLYDSLYAGGIYLIHNESGKMFATKEVEYQEHTYSHWEDHSRTIIVQVTIGEPVIEYLEELLVDEFGDPILDENGLEQYETIENPLLDHDGNPIIFNEGPIQMETVTMEVMEWVEMEVLDENGDPVLDEEGNPVFEQVEQPVLDENGNPKVDTFEQPMMDENGNPVYVEQFEVEIFIEDQREVQYLEYSAHIGDSPLSQLAQRFVDKIVSEYYNWNFYRVNNYRIDNHSFAYNEEGIFYMEWLHEEGQSEGTQLLKKVTFDPEFNEVLIENFLDITKAGFDQCELIIDPLNNNIICDPWDGNIKIYSGTHGLMTVPDSDTLQPVTFPNGELYFYDYQDEYVEELGYWTTALYTIADDGSMEAHYIELGERNELCFGECNYGVNVDMYTPEGVLYSEMNWVDMVMESGTPTFDNANLTLLSIGEFDATRPACEDQNGCWYDIVYELVNPEGELIMKVHASDNYYPGDTPPNFIERYVIDEDTIIDYEQVWTQNDVFCENEIGCTNNMRLIDESINNHGLWLHDNTIVNQGDKFLEEIRIKDSSNVTYEYTKDLAGEVCSYETCTEWVDIFIYDTDGELLTNTNVQIDFAQDEIIPLHIDYNITNDTQVIYKTDVCTSSDGCWEWYNSDEGFGYGISYEQDDVMYHSIVFAETDSTHVTEETLTREVCTNPDGCWYGESMYVVVDELGEELYVFENGGHVEYGYRLPFKAIVPLADCDVFYQKEHIDEDAICNETFCHRGVNIELDGGDGNNINLGWGNIQVPDGEKMMYRIVLSADSYLDSEDERVCLNEEGCMMYSRNFTLLDENGFDHSRDNEDDNWWQSLPVFFAYGETMPNNEEFEVSFQVTNQEYRKYRISVHEFIHKMHEVVVLDDNLYLIERESWQQGEDNFILTFNEETDRYQVKFTNISAVLEITEFEEGFIAINDDETAIIQFTYNEEQSSDDYYFFDVTNLTEGLQINGVNDLIVDYDGSIYFQGVDNFIQDITGYIDDQGVVHIDTEYVEHEVVRVRPIN